MTRLGVLWDYVPPVTYEGEGELGLDELKRGAGTHRFSLRVWTIRNTKDVEAALVALPAEHVDALYVTAGSVHLQAQTTSRIVQFAQERRLPTMTDFGGTLFRAGMLISYSANPVALARQAAGFVDRILRGARPADLPIERPSKVDLAINLKTAKALGLTIPQSLLQRADQVIE